MTATTRLPPTSAERARALLVSRIEASQRLGVSKSTFFRLVAAGALLPVRPTPTSQPRYRMEDLLRLSQSTS